MKAAFNIMKLISLCWLITHFELRAQIICTDVVPDLVSTQNSTVDIDLNNDATIDFRITGIYAAAGPNTISAVFFQANQVGLNNSVLTSGTGSVLALPLNSVIGSASTTWSLMNSTNPQMLQVINGLGSGTWVGAIDQYVGLKLVVGVNTYYGWARFSFQSTSNTYTFKDYAYNSVPNQQILAGQGCGSISSPVFSISNNLCAGTSVTVTAGTGTAVPSTYSWAVLPLGTTVTNSTSASAGITFTAAGTYTVLLAVTGGTAVGAAQNTVVVNANPTVAISGNTLVCTNQSINLTAGATLATTYLWSGPNSYTSNLQTLLISGPAVNASGNYSITVTGAGSCTAGAVQSVTVTALPVAGINLNSPLCEHDTLHLAGSGGGSYTWSGPNGFTATQQSTDIVNANLSSAGVYTLTVVNGPCTVSTTQAVVVNSLPAFTLSSNSPVCETKTVNITLNAAAGSTFHWSGPNSFTSTLQNPVISNASPNASGTYVVLITSAQGCTVSTSQPVIVNSKPSFTTSSNSPVCETKSLSLTSNNVINATTYSWQGPSTFVATTQNVVRDPSLLSYAGIYTLTITDVNSCQNTSTINISILPSPVVSVSTTSLTVCKYSTATLTAAGALNYSWSSGESTATVIITPTTNTAYTVTGTNSQGCENKTVFTQSVTICTGMNIIASGSAKIRMFPNPVKDRLYFQFEKPETIQVEILDITGKQILSRTISFENTGPEQSILILSFPSGVYFVKMHMEDGTSEARKLIKE